MTAGIPPPRASFQTHFEIHATSTTEIVESSMDSHWCLHLGNNINIVLA